MRRIRPPHGAVVETCPICGGAFDSRGYHVAVAGVRYDSIECALRARAATARREADATDEWVEEAKRRLGIEPRE